MNLMIDGNGLQKLAVVLCWLFVLIITLPLQANEKVSVLSEQQYLQLTDYLLRLLQGSEQPTAAEWQQLGLVLDEETERLTLSSDEKLLYGLGKLTINKKTDPRDRAVMIQAPHQFYDRNTGSIARELFREGNFLIHIENTVQRYRTKMADMSRHRFTLFAAIAEAFVQHYPEGRVIQIHGFSSKKRNSKAGLFADVILSNGTTFPDSYLRGLQFCHRTEAGLLSRVFGLDIFELGATSNKIGQALNQLKVGNFIHIELSDKIREKHADEKWLREMSLCIKTS